MREVFLVADDGVFPADQGVTILQRQTVEVEEHLKGVELGEIRHGLALAPAGERLDHLSSVALQHRPGLTQPGRAEVGLQNFAVAGVLRRVERQRDHRQRIGWGLQDR